MYVIMKYTMHSNVDHKTYTVYLIIRDDGLNSTKTSENKKRNTQQTHPPSPLSASTTDASLAL